MRNACFLYLLLLLFADASEGNAQLPGNADTSWLALRRSGLLLCASRGKLGLCDTSGRVLTAPSFDKIFPFEGNLARVARNGALGWIDRRGNLQFPALADLSSFSEERAAYRAERDDRWGIIRADGQVVRGPAFDELGAFREGWAPFRNGIHYGIVDSTGKERILFDTSMLSDLKNPGLPGVILPTDAFLQNPERAWLSFREGRAIYPQWRKGRRLFGYLGPDGKPLIAAQFRAASNFRDGVATVYTEAGWGIIDRAGHWLLPARYRYAEVEKDSFLILGATKGLGIADRKGRWLIAPRYRKIIGACDSLFYVCGSSGWGLVRAPGRTVLPAAYLGIRPFGAGRFLVTRLLETHSLNTGIPRFSFTGGLLIVRSDGHIDNTRYSFSETKMGRDWFDWSLVTESPQSFAAPGVFSEGLLPLARSEGGAGFLFQKDVSFPANWLDTTGGLFSDSSWDWTGPFFGGFALVARQLPSDSARPNTSPVRYGLLNRSGALVLPVQYRTLLQGALPVAPHLFVAQLEDKWGLIDSAGRVVIPFEWDLLQAASAGLIAAKRTGNGSKEMHYGFLGIAGEVLLPPIYNWLQEDDRGQLKASDGKGLFVVDKSGW
jgi:hypothetical protein